MADPWYCLPLISKKHIFWESSHDPRHGIELVDYKQFIRLIIYTQERFFKNLS